MSDFEKDNKSLENLIDVILVKIAEEIKGNRDKYLEYVMAEDETGQWTEGRGQGFGHPGGNGAYGGYNGAGFYGNGAPKEKNSGIAKKVIIGILAALGVIGLVIALLVWAYSVKTDHGADTDSGKRDATENVEDVDTEDASAEDASAEDVSAKEPDDIDNPNTEAMAALMEEEPDVRMEYVDCIIRDMEYGENNSAREVTLVLKNTGNRILCDPSVDLSGVNEIDFMDGGVGATAPVLPGQYIMLHGDIEDLTREYLDLGSTVEVFYEASWRFEDIPLENAPERISVKEAMDESKEFDVYPKAEINLIDGSVDNSLVGVEIGLEIVDITVINEHACVEIRNNTENTIEEARVILCTLDENGNILKSGCLLNYYDDVIPPGETAKEYLPIISDEKYVVPVFWDYTSDAEDLELKYGMSYLKVIPKATSYYD